MKLNIGDLIRYQNEFGVVAQYNEDDNSFGIQWFAYPDVWWYFEKQTVTFRKVSQ